MKVQGRFFRFKINIAIALQLSRTYHRRVTIPMSDESSLVTRRKSEEEYYKLLRRWKQYEQSIAKYLRKVR